MSDLQTLTGDGARRRAPSPTLASPRPTNAKRVAALWAAAFLAAGCAHDVNLRTAAGYAGACAAFQEQNDWWRARLNCGRAATNADLGRASERARAALWYEYGRASGAVCDYAEAKRGLDTAMSLDEKSGGPVFMSLLELARLHLQQGKASEALVYYERFEAAVPQDRAVKEDPVGYADVLDEYARAADATGSAQRAGTLRTRAHELRQRNPSKISNTDRTPYGKYCHQKR